MPTGAMSHTGHHRSSSSTHIAHKKRSSASGRPVLIRKNTSSKSLANRRSTSQDSEEEDEMSTGFQQYCATCDKQIFVPNSSILYCSEACRRKDTSSSTPISPVQVPTAEHFDKTEPDLIPPMSPTEVKQPFFANGSRGSQSRLAESHNGSNDSVSSSVRTKRPSVARGDSEAAKYLSQFHTDPTTAHRPRSSRHSATPSLSGSPSSSFGGSLPFTPAMTGRSPGSTRFTTTKSVDLVTPTAALPPGSSSLDATTLETLHTDDLDHTPRPSYNDLDETEDEGLTIAYGKRPQTTPGLASSSLKQLLSGDTKRTEKVR